MPFSVLIEQITQLIDDPLEDILLSGTIAYLLSKGCELQSAPTINWQPYQRLHVFLGKEGEEKKGSGHGDDIGNEKTFRNDLWLDCSAGRAREGLGKYVTTSSVK
ncbi:hypothetical protein HPP92_014442 [Vanilla planifolia]|uniref:Uncharacterized protein n=1 Tax=Vanilla planifolia TaxID=51239 RepID=A0A835UU27_VANPL|nr:hypothetical protein HPP92_014442 [Vanilla planifolia]